MYNNYLFIIHLDIKSIIARELSVQKAKKKIKLNFVVPMLYPLKSKKPFNLLNGFLLLSSPSWARTKDRRYSEFQYLCQLINFCCRIVCLYLSYMIFCFLNFIMLIA